MQDCYAQSCNGRFNCSSNPYNCDNSQCAVRKSNIKDTDPRAVLFQDNTFSVLEDSGNRTQFGTGAVRDMHEGKGRFDLIPIDTLAKVAFSLTSRSAFYSSIEKFQERQNTYEVVAAIKQLVRENYDSEDVEKGMHQMLIDLAKHYENGAKKYGEHNWEKGIPLHSFIDSALRHYSKFMAGINDEPHLIACIWNLFGAIWTFEHRPDLDDFTIKSDENQKENEVSEL